MAAEALGNQTNNQVRTTSCRRVARAAPTGRAADVTVMLDIINQAACAYRGVIPDDRWHEPYMSADELRREMDEGVVFWVAENEERLTGVMGMQDRGDVALVRHAYVSPAAQRRGVGTRLLRHVEGLTEKPILGLKRSQRNSMTDESSPNHAPAPDRSNLVILGGLVAAEITILYAVIALETPLTPLVHRLLQNPAGVFTLVMSVVLVLILGMVGILSWAEWQQKWRTANGPAI